MKEEKKEFNRYEPHNELRLFFIGARLKDLNEKEQLSVLATKLLRRSSRRCVAGKSKFERIVDFAYKRVSRTPAHEETSQASSLSWQAHSLTDRLELWEQRLRLAPPIEEVLGYTLGYEVVSFLRKQGQLHARV